jgi:FixJ family two-component response regulator
MVDETRLRRVAVIEDDDVARSALARLLHVGGFETALFDSAETFIASSGASPWLCLIVDVQLTGMSGLDLQVRLRAEGSDVPVIVITANPADVVRERAERAGCAAFLCKPFSGTAILHLLASIADQPPT